MRCAPRSPFSTKLFVIAAAAMPGVVVAVGVAVAVGVPVLVGVVTAALAMGLRPQGAMAVAASRTSESRSSDFAATSARGESATSGTGRSGNCVCSWSGCIAK